MLLKRKRVCAPVRNSSLFFFYTLACCLLNFLVSFDFHLHLPPHSHHDQKKKKKDLQAQRNIPIPVVIVLLKHVRHTLQTDARLHEQVEAHVVVAAAVVRRVQQLHKLRGQAVPKGDEGVGELAVGNAAGAVGVEAVEEVAPRGEEAPEAALGRVSAMQGKGEEKSTRILQSLWSRSGRCRTCWLGLAISYRAWKRACTVSSFAPCAGRRDSSRRLPAPSSARLRSASDSHRGRPGGTGAPTRPCRCRRAAVQA